MHEDGTITAILAQMLSAAATHGTEPEACAEVLGDVNANLGGNILLPLRLSFKLARLAVAAAFCSAPGDPLHAALPSREAARDASRGCALAGLLLSAIVKVERVLLVRIDVVRPKGEDFWLGCKPSSRWPKT